MYKILYLTQFPQIGGGETALLYLISKLDKRRFETHVILPKKGQFYNRLRKLKVKTYTLNLPPYLVRTLFVPGLSPLALAKLLKLTKKIDPDLIHVNHLTLSIYAGIVAKILKLPTVGTAHGVWDSLYFYQNLFYRLFIRKIIANTYKTANNIKRHGFYHKRNIKTVYFGIDTNFYRPPTPHEKIKAKSVLNIPSDYIVVSCVGRLDPQKDHLTFLKAIKFMEKVKKQNISFLIIGSKYGDFSKMGTKSSAYFATLKDLKASDKYLTKHVKFIPYQENMTTVYRATDVSVSTSSSIAESFGLALLEASSCGIPIVSTKTSSQQLIVKNGKTGFFVSPKRPDLLAQKILILATNPKMRRRFGKESRKHILENFNLKNYVHRVEKIYTHLIKDST